MNILYKPNNLKIDKLLARFEPTGIRKFDKELVFLITHTIITRSRYCNRNHLYPGLRKPYYIPLSSRILKDTVGYQYREYLNWMKKAGIILADECYIQNERCKAFRLTDHYLGSGVRCHHVTTKKICNIRTEMHWEHSPKTMKKLLKWLSVDELIIDIESAQKTLKEQMEKKIAHYRGEKSSEYILKAHKTYEKKLCVVRELLEAEKSVSQDKTGTRLHTPLTRLDKMSRKFVKVQGEGLQQIDLKNSQLFMALYLLNPKHWAINERDVRLQTKLFHKTSFSVGKRSSKRDTIKVLINNTVTTSYIFLYHYLPKRP